MECLLHNKGSKRLLNAARSRLVQVPGELEGKVAQQRGGDVHRRAAPRPQPRQRPHRPRQAHAEGLGHLCRH